jgi:hypothetical protein
MRKPGEGVRAHLPKMSLHSSHAGTSDPCLPLKVTCHGQEHPRLSGLNLLEREMCHSIVSVILVTIERASSLPHRHN